MPDTGTASITRLAFKRFMPVLCTLLLLACQTPAPQSSATPARNQKQEKVASEALAKAQRFYDAGEFEAVVSLLNGNKEIGVADVKTQVQAHKLLAFVYGATGRPALCYTEFSRVLALDPAFQLTPAERSHPTWGRMYELARTRPAT